MEGQGEKNSLSHAEGQWRRRERRGKREERREKRERVKREDSREKTEEREEIREYMNIHVSIAKHNTGKPVT